MDTTRLGETAAALMELLAEEEDEDTELGIVMVLAEISGSDDRGQWTGIRFRCSDARDWIQRGMLSAALGSERQADPMDEDEDDE